MFPRIVKSSLTLHVKSSLTAIDLLLIGRESFTKDKPGSSSLYAEGRSLSPSPTQSCSTCRSHASATRRCGLLATKTPFGIRRAASWSRALSWNGLLRRSISSLRCHEPTISVVSDEQVPNPAVRLEKHKLPAREQSNTTCTGLCHQHFSDAFFRFTVLFLMLVFPCVKCGTDPTMKHGSGTRLKNSALDLQQAISTGESSESPCLLVRLKGELRCTPTLHD